MKNLLITIACASSLVAGIAWARTLITTQAGCNNEFGVKGAKACVACVKGGGKYAKHPKNKGAWVCE